MKSLEAEVERAACREATLTREVEHLRRTVERLTGILSEYEMSIPPSHSGEDEHGGDIRAAVEILEKAAVPVTYPVPSQGPKVPVTVATQSNIADHELSNAASHLALQDPESSHTHHTAVLVDQHYRGGLTRPLPAAITKGNCRDGGSRLQEADLVAVAMEFVLTYAPPQGTDINW